PPGGHVLTLVHLDYSGHHPRGATITYWQIALPSEFNRLAPSARHVFAPTPLTSSPVTCDFFFSSRRRHTRLVSDWSSDVCSSDLLKESVHDLEAVRVAVVIAEQNVVLEEVDVVLAAVQEDDAVLQQLVKRQEVFAEKRPARLEDDVLLDVNEHLCHLLAHAAHHPAPRRLQLGKPRFDDVRLLAALEMLAALPDPLLPFLNQVGELVADLEVQELQDSQPEEQVDLDVFLVFGVGQGALQHFGEQLAKGDAV